MCNVRLVCIEMKLSLHETNKIEPQVHNENFKLGARFIFVESLLPEVFVCRAFEMRDRRDQPSIFCDSNFV